jgi:ketosteroid isomerase-like protein
MTTARTATPLFGHLLPGPLSIPRAWARRQGGQPPACRRASTQGTMRVTRIDPAPPGDALEPVIGRDGPDPRREQVMSELDDFRSTILTRFVAAEEALHNGDPEPRLAMWSDQDPVTLFGAWGPCKSGWKEVSPVFRWLASRFSGVSDYRLDLVAAGLSGDLAYTVGFERSRVSIDGGPAQENVLRVTHVFRRENGEWKIVHRHGDFVPSDQGLP